VLYAHSFAQCVSSMGLPCGGAGAPGRCCRCWAAVVKYGGVVGQFHLAHIVSADEGEGG
jgi:hypothetical protein